MLELAVIIPTLGTPDSLDAVIDGLARQGPQTEAMSVFVVVDAAGPAGWQPRSPRDQLPFRIEVLKARRPGASAARNVGWRAAAAQITLFLDDDVVPTGSLIAEHLRWHRRYPDVGVGVLGRVHWSPNIDVTPFMRWLDMGFQFDYGTIRGTEAGWEKFYSCNVSVKTSILERTGGFNETAFPYLYEDTELARRLSTHGFRLLYNAAAVGEHLKIQTFDGWRQKLGLIARAERRFVELYPDERPYFHDRFFYAAQAPSARGRASHLVRFVPPRMPWLGRIVWSSYDMVCRQRLAPYFLDAWERAERELEYTPYRDRCSKVDTVRGRDGVA